MSLYGQVAKIGSASFQFDRIYSTRFDMDDNANRDGVYAGRYVLVEYGERYDSSHNETEAFSTNRDIDLQHYGNTYDSTVWQKVYAKNTGSGKTDKYIMVAELNAKAPDLDIIIDSPLTYKPYAGTEPGDHNILAGKFKDNDGSFELVKISNTEEIYNEAHFDPIFDTELSYRIHMPTNLELGISNETINYNEKGFNKVYGYAKDKGYTGISWIPEGLQYEITSTTQDDNGAYPAQLSGSPQNINKKVLYMNFPELGNIISDLYDVIYGRASEEDLAHGGMRPYFARYLNSIQLTVPVKVQGQEVTINGEVLTVTGGLGERVPAIATSSDIQNQSTIQPNNLVTIVYWDGMNQIQATPGDGLSAYFYEIQSDNSLSPDHIIYVDIPQYPTGDTDDLSWLKSLAESNEYKYDTILQNNSSGLALLLQSLLGYYDPTTGSTKYYMYADWLAEEDPDLSDPAISNKPKTIGGYNTNFNSVKNYYKLGDQLIQTAQEIETSIDYISGMESSDFYIDYNSWTLQGNNKDNNKYEYEKFAIANFDQDYGNQTPTQTYTRSYRRNNWGYNITFSVYPQPIESIGTEEEPMYRQNIAIKIQFQRVLGTGSAGRFYNYYAMCNNIDDFSNNKAIVFGSNTTITTGFRFTSSTDKKFKFPLYFVGYNGALTNGNYCVEDDPIEMIIFEPVQPGE